jgi:hypothetical protein
MDAMLQIDWLVSSLLPYIGAFRDLRSFAVSNKANLAAVRSLTGMWPDEIRELLTTWCTETPVPIYFARAQLTHRLRIVAPVRFQADHLSYDSVGNKVRGQPWSHVKFCSKHLLRVAAVTQMMIEPTYFSVEAQEG